MAGASAARISSQRRIGNVSKPVQLKSLVPHTQATWKFALPGWRNPVSPSEYQGMNRRLSRSSDDASPPITSLAGLSREKSTARELIPPIRSRAHDDRPPLGIDAAASG